MLKQTFSGNRLSPWVLIGLVGACGLISWPAAGTVSEPICGIEPLPVCGDSEREAFLADAEAGVPIEELVELYGHCAKEALPTSMTEKTIIINNGVGSIFYERMNGCGYHPQARHAACDVEVRRNTWYGPFPAGSNEWVTFCFFCGGGWIPIQGSVHVTNDVQGVVPPSFGFMAFAPAPANCPAGNGVSFPIRAVLSWAVPAGNPCTLNPVLVWGNQIILDTRADP